MHSQIKVQSFFGLGQEQSHQEESTFEADHPEVFAATDKGITPIEYLIVGLASCLSAGVASVAQNRGIQLRSVEATVEGDHDIRGILGADSDVRNGFNDIKVTFHIDADASKEDIEALVAQSQKRSAVFDALTQPDERHRRSRLREPGHHRAAHHGRHRGGARGPCREPLPQRPVDRSCRARARRGGELLAARTLGLAAAAHSQLAKPAAGPSLSKARTRTAT